MIGGSTMDSLTVRLMASSGKYSEAVDYWLEQLAESSAPTTLSLGRENGIVGPSFRQVEQQLSKETLHQVELLSKNSEQAMFMVLMSGTLLFLSRYLNLADLLVGMPPLKKKEAKKWLRLYCRFEFKWTLRVLSGTYCSRCATA